MYAAGTPPHKRQRLDSNSAPNGAPKLPPLSLSILGVEPMDEFIKEIADFVHHMIVNRPTHIQGNIEVEAKVGVLRDKGQGGTPGGRIALPVLVETSTSNP